MKPSDLVVGEFYAFERKERLMFPKMAKVVAVSGENASVEIQDMVFDASRGEWMASDPTIVSGEIPCRTLHMPWSRWVCDQAALRARIKVIGDQFQADRESATRAVAACAALGIVARPDSLTNDIRVTSTERLAWILERAAESGFPAGPS